jgi:ribonuclease D
VFLLQLKEAMEFQAKQKGILHWFKEENGGWDQFRYTPKAPGDVHTKYRKWLSPFQLHVMSALLTARETLARKYSKPPHYIIANDLIFEFTKNCETLATLSLRNESTVFYRVRMNAKHCEKLEAVFHSAKKEASSLNLSRSLIKEEKPSEPNTELQERFSHVRAALADEYGNYTAQFLLPSSLMRKNFESEESWADILPYRRELLRKLLIVHS